MFAGCLYEVIQRTDEGWKCMKSGSRSAKYIVLGATTIAEAVCVEEIEKEKGLCIEDRERETQPCSSVGNILIIL